MNARLALIALPVLLLAACKEKPVDDHRTATGKVLEGTIKDDMLPLERVQSQPPMLAPEVASKPGDGASGSAETDETESAAEVDAAQPVAESTAE